MVAYQGPGRSQRYQQIYNLELCVPEGLGGPEFKAELVRALLVTLDTFSLNIYLNCKTKSVKFPQTV